MALTDGVISSTCLAAISREFPAAHLKWVFSSEILKGIIHRDLKPENVMIVPDPYMANGERTKLLDFGIAKVSELSALEPAAQGAKTKANQVMGTPDYMSPEQCSGAAGVDGKSDVYSLGVMLFKMLAGRPPFVAETSSQIMGMHMFVAPPLLRELAPNVPQPLAALVHRMLAKNAEARLTMRQLAATLEQLGEQYPLPKRSASNEALRLDEIDRPDTTILVGQKKPFTLNEESATPNKKTVPQAPPWQLGPWKLHRRQLMTAVGLAGGAVAACVLTWLCLRAPQEPRNGGPSVPPVRTDSTSASSPGSPSAAHSDRPQPALDMDLVESPGATVKSSSKAPDPLTPTIGGLSSGLAGKPVELTKVPNNTPVLKARSESDKRAQAMLELGKSSCRKRNVDKANRALDELATDKAKQRELLDYCVQNKMHEGNNGKLFLLKMPF